MINDPKDERPRALEELDNLHVGPAPINAVIDAAVSTRRRRGAMLASAAAVLVVLVGATAVSTQVLGVAGDDDALIADGDAPPATPELPATQHTVTVNAAFKPGTPRLFYFEGSLEEVRLERTTSSEPVQVESATASAPWQQEWSDLPSGEYTIYAAIRPCGGNCSYLDPPADTCEQTFTLDSDVAVAVEFEYGESCRVTATPQEAATPTQDLTVSVDILAPGGTEAVPPGTARWDPDGDTLAYVGRLDYSGSCLPEGTATSTEGSVDLVLTVSSEETPCTADANTVFATITGLTEAPSNITVTEDGKPRTISVETPQAPRPLSSTPSKVVVTRCSDVLLPDGGLGEADYNVDKERQLLTINFSDTRAGRYRNVSYTVRYEADPSCNTTPQMAEVIARVLPRR